MGDTLLFYVGTSIPPDPILHTYRLISDGVNEGFLSAVAESINYQWDSGGPTTSMSQFSTTSTRQGDVTQNSSTITVPAAPGASSGRTLTGNYRTVMETTVTANHTPNTLGDNWAQSDIHPISTWPGWWSQTEYDSTNSGTHPGAYLWEYTNGLDAPFSISDNETRYYYDDEDYDPGIGTSDDLEGTELEFRVDATGWDTDSAGMTSVSTIEVNTMYQESESSNDNVGNWSTVYNATDATGTSGYLKAREDTTSYTEWELSRGFLTFSPRSDLTSFTGRTVTSIKLELDDLTNGVVQDSIIQEGTQVGGGGEVSEELLDSDFNNFTGSPLTPTISGWDSGNDYIFIDFNSTGDTFVTSKIEAQNDIQFCMRDYPTDYSAGAVGTPAADVRFRFGGNGAYDGDNPVISIEYMKIPEWTDHTHDWTFWRGTYSNGKYYPEDIFGWEIWGTPNGGWEVDYRPVAMRVTFEGAASIDTTSLTAKDQWDEYLKTDLVNVDDAVSEQVSVIYFQSNDSDTDIEEFYYKHNTDGWYITKIEFLEA